MDVNHRGPPGTDRPTTTADTRLGSCALLIKAKQGSRPGTECSKCFTGQVMLQLCGAGQFYYALSSCFRRQIFTPDYCVPIAAITAPNILLEYAGMMRFCG